jgi:hypothetical protein
MRNSLGSDRHHLQQIAQRAMLDCGFLEIPSPSPWPRPRTRGGLFSSQEWRIASSPGSLGCPPRSAKSSSAPATGPGFPPSWTQRPVPASVPIRCRGRLVVPTVERLAGQGDRGGSPPGMLMPVPAREPDGQRPELAELADGREW